MNVNKINFSYTDYSIVNENEKIIKKIKVPRIVKYRNLLCSCYIGLSSVIINSKLLKLDTFPNLKTKEDYVLWLKLSKKNVKMLGVNKNLTYWRKTNESLSSSSMQKLKIKVPDYSRS